MRSDVALSRRSLIAEATAALSAAGVAEPRREALRLWSELRGGSPVEVLLDGEAEADVATASALRQVVGRRVAGEPLAHVTGRIASPSTLTIASVSLSMIDSFSSALKTPSMTLTWMRGIVFSWLVG